jgi:hypothetical protein
MNKPIDDPNKGKDVVTVDAPRLPAIKKPPNKWRQHRILTEQADGLVERYDELRELEQQVLKRKPGEPLPDPVQAELDEHEQWMVTKCRELMKRLDPADAYETDDDDDDDEWYDGIRWLKRSHIGKRLSLLIAAMPAGKAGTPDGFVKMLLEHVADTEMSALVLEDACRDLERHAKFLPTISEVLAAIEKHQNEWSNRRRAIRGITRESEELQALIRKLQPKVAMELAQAKQRDAKLHWLERISICSRASQEVAMRQNQAREAYQRVETAMAHMAAMEQKLDDAAQALAAATHAVLAQTPAKEKPASPQPSP